MRVHLCSLCPFHQPRQLGLFTGDSYSCPRPCLFCKCNFLRRGKRAQDRVPGPTQEPSQHRPHPESPGVANHSGKQIKDGKPGGKDEIPEARAEHWAHHRCGSASTGAQMVFANPSLLQSPAASPYLSRTFARRVSCCPHFTSRCFVGKVLLVLQHR